MLKQCKATLGILIFSCLAAFPAHAGNTPKTTIQQQIEVCQKNYTTAMQKGDVVQASKEAQKISHLRMAEKATTVSKR